MLWKSFSTPMLRKYSTIFSHAFRMLVFIFIYLLLRRVSLCCPGWNTMAWSQLIATSTSRVQVIHASASLVARITGMHHHAQLIFVFLVEMGFHHIGQAGLKLLTSGNRPTSASQSAGITSVGHGTQPSIGFQPHWDHSVDSNHSLSLLTSLPLFTSFMFSSYFRVLIMLLSRSVTLLSLSLRACLLKLQTCMNPWTYFISFLYAYT